MLDFDFLNETKYSYSNSPVTILESNGSNKLSKNVTARKLNKDEINQLTSILLTWSKLRSNSTNGNLNDKSNGQLNHNNSQMHRLRQRSIDNSKSSFYSPHINLQDISVRLLIVLRICFLKSLIIFFILNNF